MKDKLKDLFMMVCQEFKVNPDRVLSADRTRPYPDARKAFSYIAHNHLTHNYTSFEIAQIINRDRSTTITANRVADDLLRFDKSFKEKVNNLIDRINAGSMDFNAIPQF